MIRLSNYLSKLVRPRPQKPVAVEPSLDQTPEEPLGPPGLPGSKLRILLLAHMDSNHANTVIDHRKALETLSRHVVHTHCPLSSPKTLPPLEAFDAIILHYSLICFSHAYLPPFYRDAIRRFQGLKALFIQDEYRTIHAAVDAMIELGVDVLFTCVPEARIDQIYGQLRRRGVRVEPTLTGFVPEELIGRPWRPLAERPFDVVYRGRPLPPSLGRLSQEKIAIAQRFKELAPLHGVSGNVDWREENRIYGHQWIDFMSSGRAALGTESGASIADFTGEIDTAVRRYMREHPEASLDEIEEAILAPFEGNLVINTISPRSFEAICLGTVMVNFPGEYSGILQPERHYIVLEKDFSNFADVAAQLRDTDKLSEIAKRAYEDIVLSGTYSYAAFVKTVDAILDEEWRQRCFRPALPLPATLDPSERQRSRWDGLTPSGWRDRLKNAKWMEMRLNVLRAGMGAFVTGSSPFFPRPFDPDCLLREGEPESYAAAIADTAKPHWIEFDLSETREVNSLELEWLSDTNFAQSFKVEITEDGEVWRDLLVREDSTDHKLEFQFPLTRVRRVRLVADRFSDQDRMLVRGFALWKTLDTIP